MIASSSHACSATITVLSKFVLACSHFRSQLSMARERRRVSNANASVWYIDLPRWLLHHNPKVLTLVWLTVLQRSSQLGAIVGVCYTKESQSHLRQEPINFLDRPPCLCTGDSSPNYQGREEVGSLHHNLDRVTCPTAPACASVPLT